MSGLARMYATVLGAVLTLVGALGFIPALAPNGNLLGIFAIDPVHNIVHLLSGIVGLAVAYVANGAYSRWYAGIFGAVYALVTIIGFIQGNTVLGLINVNLADNLLHTAIAVASLLVFFLASSTVTSRTARA
ncbi:MAG TPA: DUF4383 domain-containing protein [Ktedonobacterales bacterium]|nr:DUF4383 domain-containing protein [Ktedonobacterales bacterium]